jgi:hypothetical protein
MTRGNAFWVIILILVLFSGAAYAGFGREYSGAGNLIILVLLVLLGWDEYGPPFRGGS